MNWLPVDDQDPPAPFPPGRGWCDVWPTLRGGDPGWTYDSQKAPQKGKKYGRGVSENLACI